MVFERKLNFASIDIISWKKYRVNTGIFFVFHAILMYTGSIYSSNNFLCTCHEEISELFNYSKTIYNSL